MSIPTNFDPRKPGSRELKVASGFSSRNTGRGRRLIPFFVVLVAVALVAGVFMLGPLFGKSELQELTELFGSDRIVTITVTNIGGNQDKIARYIERRLFKAAYVDYQAEAKKENAPSKLNPDFGRFKDEKIHAGQRGLSAIRPGDYVKDYPAYLMDTPFPKAVRITASASGTVFAVGPCDSIDTFSKRIDFGTVTLVNDGVISVDGNLPSPVPHPDVDELQMRYGRNHVAIVQVNHAKGDPDLVIPFLQLHSDGLEVDNAHTVADGFHHEGNNIYTYAVAPVRRLQPLADQLTFGQILYVDQSARVITINATLPSPLPDRKQLVEMGKKQREQRTDRMRMDLDERIEANRRRSAEKWRDRNENTNRGELDLEQSLGIVRENRPRFKEAVRFLRFSLDLEPDQRDELMSLLLRRMQDQELGVHVEPSLQLIMQWHTPETDQAIIDFVVDQSLESSELVPYLSTLAEIGTAESIETLASFLSSNRYYSISRRYLIELGPVAEDAALKQFIFGGDITTQRAKSVLEKIGTEKTVKKLESILEKEERGVLFSLSKSLHRQLRNRLDRE